MAYVLLYLLEGSISAAQISEQMPERDIRSIQRALVRLTELALVTRKGVNNPTYSLNYDTLVGLDIPPRLLELEDRPISHLHHGFMKWLEGLSPAEIDQLFGNQDDKIPLARIHTPMSAKELEYLTVELSWKSAALEGNTYTLLDTQLLLTEGVKAKNKTDFETQMILNHKNAINFMTDHNELFSDNTIGFRTVEELHKIIGYNLGIESGVRKKIVKITSSNYQPLDNPYQLRESMDVVLAVISRATNPFAKALLALTLVPYLQVFEDGNKRTGRLLANGLLMSTIGRGFSLRKVTAKELALAYLCFYEFNSVASLKRLLLAELT